MLKLLGAIMLMGATVAIGATKVSEMTLRVHTLEGFSSAFDRICSEISYSLTPLPELFYQLSRTLPDPVNGFFSRCLELGDDLTQTGLESVWTQSLDTLKGLDQGDRRMIAQAGCILGRYDPENQRQSLAFVAQSVDRRLAAAEEKRRNEGRSCAVVAAASGLALIIIFI